MLQDHASDPDQPPDPRAPNLSGSKESLYSRNQEGNQLLLSHLLSPVDLNHSAYVAEWLRFLILAKRRTHFGPCNLTLLRA